MALEQFLSSGGAQDSPFFYTHANAANTAMVVGKTTSTPTTPVAATAWTDAAFRFLATDSTAVKLNEDGTAEVTLGNYDDTPEFWAFLAEYALPTADSTGTLSEIKWEKGGTAGGSAANSGRYGTLVIGGSVINQSGVKKRKITVLYGSISATSGSWTQKQGDANKPEVVFKSTKAPFDIVIPKTILSADLWDSTKATDVKLSKGLGIKVDFLAVA